MEQGGRTVFNFPWLSRYGLQEEHIHHLHPSHSSCSIIVILLCAHGCQQAHVQLKYVWMHVSICTSSSTVHTLIKLTGNVPLCVQTHLLFLLSSSDVVPLADSRGTTCKMLPPSNIISCLTSHQYTQMSIHVHIQRFSEILQIASAIR